jgi:putative transposase
VIRLVVLMHVRFPLSPRNIEDLRFEHGIDLCREAVRLWWNRFCPLFAADIRRQRPDAGLPGLAMGISTRLM